MASSAETIRDTLDKIKGINGDMITVDMKQQGLTKRKILTWQRRLREAADELEKLL